jgi:hypothetical protein
MASVRDIRLYPIKGLGPICVSEAQVMDSGALAWDRRFALVDERGRFVNGKNYPAIQTVRAEFNLHTAEVVLDRGGRAYSLFHQGPRIAGWMEERLGATGRFALREDAITGFPDDLDSPGPTFIGEATLDTVAAWFALDRESARRRFRANIEVAALEPFGEDRWYGGCIHVGAGQASWWANNPCARCAVPARDPFTGAVTPPGFQKRFADLRKANLPEWADRARFDHFYRLAVNTRPAFPDGGAKICVGERVEWMKEC